MRTTMEMIDGATHDNEKLRHDFYETIAQTLASQALPIAIA